MLTTNRTTAIAVCVGLAMLLTALAGRRERFAAVVLILLAVAWFAVDNTFEGPVLVPLSHQHGLTLADLPGVAALVVAARLARHRRPRPGDSQDPGGP